MAAQQGGRVNAEKKKFKDVDRRYCRIVGLLLRVCDPVSVHGYQLPERKREANKLSLSLPTKFEWSNFVEVFQTNDYQILTAFKNSIILTVGAVVILVVFSAMAGYVIQRRKDRSVKIASTIIMTGLMIPAAILPTIWVMQTLHIYKTMPGMILVEVALHTPFTIMLYRGFMSTIPIELEEAAYIDGCTPFQVFRMIIFPLLKPVTSTVIILDAVTIFNDFTNPLYSSREMRMQQCRLRCIIIWDSFQARITCCLRMFLS